MNKKIQLYGSPLTAAGRCYLVLEEIGLPYETVPLDPVKGETQSPELLVLNPNGRVPCLVDETFVLWESVAITFYLAEKYKPELLGSSLEERARCFQWSLWCLTEFQQPFIELGVQHLVSYHQLSRKQDPTRAEKAKRAIPRLLGMLDTNLKDQRYIAGPDYTVADANIAIIASLATSLKIDITPYAALSRWFAQVCARPAWSRFVRIKAEAVKKRQR